MRVKTDTFNDKEKRRFKLLELARISYCIVYHTKSDLIKQGYLNCDCINNA